MAKIIPIPDSISEESGFRGTVLVRRWKKSAVQLGFLTLFCIGWNAFLVFWYWMAFSTDSPWIAKVFPVAHVGVGIGLTYYLFAMFLNRTDITVTSSTLEIRTHPVPWRGNKKVPTTDIAQLFVTEKNHKNSYGAVTKSFELHMIDQRNQQSPLLKNLPSAQEALYLEKRIEELLRIENQPVAGAYEG